LHIDLQQLYQKENCFGGSEIHELRRRPKQFLCELQGVAIESQVRIDLVTGVVAWSTAAHMACECPRSACNRALEYMISKGLTAATSNDYNNHTMTMTTDKKTNNNNYTVGKHKLKHEDPNSQIDEKTPEGCLQEATHSKRRHEKTNAPIFLISLL